MGPGRCFKHDHTHLYHLSSGEVKTGRSLKFNDQPCELRVKQSKCKGNLKKKDALISPHVVAASVSNHRR